MDIVEQLRGTEVFNNREIAALEEITALRSQLAETQLALEQAQAKVARLEEEKATLCGYVEKLWDVIDDIDTYGDMAKSDDRLFRSLVERRQKDRWKTGITTDGYELQYPEKTGVIRLSNGETIGRDRLEVVGGFVTGDGSAKFGLKNDLVYDLHDDSGYWKNRGYEWQPVYRIKEIAE